MTCAATPVVLRCLFVDVFSCCVGEDELRAVAELMTEADRHAASAALVEAVVAPDLAACAAAGLNHAHMQVRALNAGSTSVRGDADGRLVCAGCCVTSHMQITCRSA